MHEGVRSNKPNQTLWKENQIVKNHSDSVSVSGYICIQMQAGLKSEFDMPQAADTQTHTLAGNWFPNNILLLKTFRHCCQERAKRGKERPGQARTDLPNFFNYNLICKWHRAGKHGKKLKWETLRVKSWIAEGWSGRWSAEWIWNVTSRVKKVKRY